MSKPIQKEVSEKAIKAIKEFAADSGGSFEMYIESVAELSSNEKNFILEIYQKASAFELWNFSNINTGRKNAIRFLQENYTLDQKTCEVMVRDISYNWL